MFNVFKRELFYIVDKWDKEILGERVFGGFKVIFVEGGRYFFYDIGNVIKWDVLVY